MRSSTHSLPAAPHTTAPPSLVGCIVLLCLLCADIPAFGQSRMFIGLEGRLHDVRHSGSFGVVDNPDLPLFSDGKQQGQSVGIKLQHRTSSSFSLSGTIAYNRLPGLFEMSLLNPAGEEFDIQMIGGSVNLDPEHAFTGDKIFTLTTEVAYTTLSLEALGEWKPIGKKGKWSIGVAAGPTLHWTLTENMRQKVKLDEPQNMRFINGHRHPTKENGRMMTIYDGNLLQPESLRLGMRGGIFAEFGNPDSGIIISPGIFYEPALSHLRETEDWTIRMLTAQVSVMIGL